jgi:type II secretory ATPase GspE/PulE/Tfp pilus assembly ATPase PilB-like protein
MVPSPSNPGQPENSSQQTPSAQVSEIAGIKTEQMFRLIDSILPFEACLYHQFLPVALEGKYLRLAMVSPQDSSALDYARRILAYLNCSLKTVQITPEVHQSLLSAYLSHTHQSESVRQQAHKDKDKAAQTQQVTRIGDDSQALEGESGAARERTSLSGARSDNSLSPTSPSQPPRENSSNSLTPTQTSFNPSELPNEAAPATAVTSIRKVSLRDETVPPLEVQALHLSRPMEFIGTLAPQQLLQELLGRVLIGGIGRLYFERQPEQGRVLWSQDGVLQSVLEGLSLTVFQGLIIELKRIVNLPLLPVVQPKQVEIERRYQQECLLLRLRVMPGSYGEEATLQVLRGVALKFYQRQQLETLGQDALRLAQQLQRKLTEIRDRSYRYPLPLDTLPALNQQLRDLDEQLEALAQLQMNQDFDN